MPSSQLRQHLNRQRVWLTLIVLGVSLVFLFLGYFYYLFYQRPMLPAGASPALVALNKQTSATAFINTLSQEHYIQYPQQVRRLVRLLGMSPKLKAGIYQIQRDEAIMPFLARVVAGDVARFGFQINAGVTKCYVDSLLPNAPYLTTQGSDWSLIQHATEQPDSLFFHPDLGAVPEPLEGMLLADTYYYDAGSDASQLLMQAHEQLKKVLAEQWQHRASGLPYANPYELLVVASILEKEAASYDEKRLISGVIVNRLRKHMRLQMDPTAIYGRDQCYRNIRPRDDITVDSPYNTYRKHGLPPTPIAMVGLDAIRAAAQPMPSSYLYFVAKGDGTHEFSTTYEEQRQAIERLRRLTAQHVN